MPSPFPGMDPYIEQSSIWVDFHNGLADEIRAHLNAHIRPAYFARLTPYVTYEVIEVAQSKIYNIRPGVEVMQRRELPTSGGGVAVLEHDEVTAVENIVMLNDEVELLSVEIRRAGNEELVTAIEILSPVNKQPGHPAYTDYLRKRRDLHNSDAHLLEIDLLRGGTRPPLLRPVPVTPYYITLSRANQRPLVTVWPIPLHARLPKLPVPLRAPDPDVLLPLNEIVATVYERGGYDAQIDYHQPVPPPPLTAEEAAWVETVLAEFTQT
jgi:hypothetical protein